MSSESRRSFLASSGKLIVGTIALGSIGAYAADTSMPARSGQGLAIAATSRNVCATCQFWGGMRKISDDKTQVLAQSMGWCNNPNSRHHGQLTAADHDMSKMHVWRKWAAL
jgi:anaerobic selenocysteine-containing dehydrogenase